MWVCDDLRSGYHIDHGAPDASGVKAGAFAFLEFDNAVCQRKQSVVTAAADIFASPDRRAALTHDNLSGARELSVGDFYSQPLTVAVASKRC